MVENEPRRASPKFCDEIRENPNFLEKIAPTFNFIFSPTKHVFGNRNSVWGEGRRTSAK